MLAGRRFRVELTGDQAEYAEQVGAACRAVWNTGLEQRREYRRRGSWMNYVPQARELAEAKTEHQWLRDAPGHCLQQTLMDLDKACRRHGTFRVNWRSGRRWAPSFRFPAGSKMIVEQSNRRHARIKLPKLGWVKFRSSRSLAGEMIRSATLTREGQHWYLSVLVDDGISAAVVHPHSGAAVGVDRGVAVAVATSAGELHDRSFTTAGERRRIVALQRKLARTAKRSANRGKVRAALAEVRARERRRRKDFCAQTAHQLTAAHAVVVLEDLKTRNMTRTAKGTLTEPGRNVKAKSGLNRAILAKGWHQFDLALHSASRYSGTLVVKVPAAYTSQRCFKCGQVDPKSRDSQAVFRCTTCSFTEHADVNAARNILAAGLAVTACEDPPRPSGQGRSPKQEPAGNREGLLPQPAHTAPAARTSWNPPGVSRGEEVKAWVAVRFDDVSEDWLDATQAAAGAAALHTARLAAAGELVAGPAAGHELTAEEAVAILLARDIADPRFDILQPYESRWALLVVRAALGLDVANDAVSDARDRGTTWASIAEIMGGVTPQAAQQRFGKRRNPTDSGKR